MKAIYEIRNNKNGKIYVGSAKNLEKRWRQHRSSLNNGQHENSYLQSSWDKHEGNFTFTVLEEVEKDEDLIPAEQKWLDLTRSYDRSIGYNILTRAGSSLGYKHREETKRKIAEANKGKNKGKSPWNKGRTGTLARSEGTKREIAERHSADGNPAAKLTWEKVREMRAIYDRGEMGTTTLARMFGVGSSTAHRVVKRKAWINDPNEEV
jgi:group I intron endonuclease